MDEITFLLSDKAEQLSAWLQTMESQKSVIDRVRILPALAETAARKAHDYAEADPYESLAWATAALKAWAIYSQAAPSANIDLSAMMLRASMIAAHGPKKDDFVRDPDALEKWFFSKLTGSISSALGDADECQRQLSCGSVSTEVILKMKYLREIKNILSVLQEVGNIEYFSRSAEIEPWIGIKNSLP